MIDEDKEMIATAMDSETLVAVKALIRKLQEEISELRPPFPPMIRARMGVLCGSLEDGLQVIINVRRGRL